MLHRAAAPPAKRPRHTPTGAGARPSRRARPPFWRNPLVVAATVTVLVVVGVMVVVAVRGDTTSTGTGTQAAQSGTPASSAVMAAVSRPDAAVLAAVGNGGLPSSFTPVRDAAALTGRDGKPEILYIGADYCPYCAAQRWALAVALGRFGSFDQLEVSRSSSSDVFPDTATFTFRNARYSSPYLDFVAVETADRTGALLQAPTAEQQALLAKYDAPPYVAAASAGGIPWLDVANHYVMVSSGFTPAVLSGLSWDGIAARLGNADDNVARGIIGDANNITAAICTVTGMQPDAVCSSAPIAPLVATLR